MFIRPWRAMAYALHRFYLKLASFNLLVHRGIIAPLPWSAWKGQKCVRVRVCDVRAHEARLHISDVTVHGAEAWKSDASFPLKVTHGAHVDSLDQAFLIEERMVGTQCARSVIVGLVVVAQVRLPHGGNVLVHVHLLAQRHHQEDTCNVSIQEKINIFTQHLPTKLEFNFLAKHLRSKHYKIIRT